MLTPKNVWYINYGISFMTGVMLRAYVFESLALTAAFGIPLILVFCYITTRISKSLEDKQNDQR